MSFHHRSQYEGRPKAHKNFGKSKPSAANKVSGRLIPETVGKHRKFQSGFDEYRDIGKSQRQANARERRKQHRETLLKKKLQYYGKIKGGVPKIVALIPLSPFCDLKKIKKSMMRHTKTEFDTNSSLQQPVLIQSEIGARSMNYQLWVCDRNQWSILDICKVADIIILVTSPSPDLKNHEMLHKSENQHQSGNDTFRSHLLGIDDFSKEICQMIRIQGVSNIMGLYQPRFHSDLVSKGQVSKKAKNKYVVSKLDKRVLNHFGHLMKLEFGNDISKKCKFLDCYDNQQLFRFMSELKHSEIDWREKRPHLLADNMSFTPYDNDNDNSNNNNNNKNNNRKIEFGQLEVTGFLRGKQALDVRRAIHITGIGDFLISRIDGQILNKPSKVPQLPSERRKEKKEERRMQNQINIEKKIGKHDSKNNEISAFLENDNENENENEQDIDLDFVTNKNDNSNRKNVTSNDNDNIDSDSDNEIEMKSGNSKNDSSVGDFVHLMAIDKNDPKITKLDALRPLDDLATVADQSIITEEELKEADNKRRERMLKILKQKELNENGLSDYRLDWDELVGWGSESDNDEKDVSLTEKLKSIRDSNNNNNGNDKNNNEQKHNKMLETDSEIADLTVQAAALHISKEEMDDSIEVMAKKKRLEHEEMEFPDEVNTPIHIRAKDKFANYRGLKSFIRTKWDKFELLPIEYSRIFQISDWKRAKKLANLGQSMIDNSNNNNENENDNDMNMNDDNTYLIECGRKVKIYIDNVPSIILKLMNNHKHVPCLVWGLLDHEHKISVCHYGVTKDLNYEMPVQGLDTFIFDVGFRRFISKPIFSAKSRTDKHLVEKFLKTNEVSVASVYAPITYPNIPVLMFEHPQTIVNSGKKDKSNNINNCNNEMKEENELEDDIDIYDDNTLDNKDNNNRFGHKYLIADFGLLKKHRAMVANGNLLEVNAHRLLIKRKILTGYPIRVHRRRAVVRYMFWNADDVRYFMPLDLWTKHGLHGKIEEPVGEKGYMKCFFDGIIKQHDIVCLSLYRRVFPIADTNLFGQTVTQK